MFGRSRRILIVAAILFVLTIAGLYIEAHASTNPPANPVRLVFIHHSTGENWLSDSNGGLGIALRDNNYFVSDTNYDWGPDAIGSSTDIGHWWLWFRSPSSPTFLSALYAETEYHSEYSRLPAEVSGENQIIMFKSCFPNSALKGSINDPVPPIDNNPLRGESCGSEYHTVANAKGIYIDLLEYFKTRPDKLFVVITAPPLTDDAYADNARAFNNWLVNTWLKDYTVGNVFVFDFYNVLTTNGGNPDTNDVDLESGNHHRWWKGEVQHKTDGDDDANPNTLEYPTDDDHPSRAGNQKATAEFVPLLNSAYSSFARAAGPTGSIVINNGDASTTSTSVTLYLTYADANSSVSQVRYSNDGVWDSEGWEAPAATKAWTLTSGDGIKTVYYQVQNAGGMLSPTYSDTITLSTTTPPPSGDNTNPTANAGSDQTANVGASVSFDADASSDNVGVVSYDWDFGDGATGTGETVTHAYASAGTYTVTLTVEDAAGNSATDTMTVTVSAAQGAGGVEGVPSWIIGVIIAAIAILVVAVILLWRRRKHAPATVAPSSVTQPQTQQSSAEQAPQQPAPQLEKKRVCFNCGSPVRPEAQFCESCGTKLK